jgi:hypothetical protein
MGLKCRLDWDVLVGVQANAGNERGIQMGYRRTRTLAPKYGAVLERVGVHSGIHTDSDTKFGLHWDILMGMQADGGIGIDAEMERWRT